METKTSPIDVAMKELIRTLSKQGISEAEFWSYIAGSDAGDEHYTSLVFADGSGVYEKRRGD